MRSSEAARVAIARWKTILGNFRLKSLHCKSFGHTREWFYYTPGVNFPAADSEWAGEIRFRTEFSYTHIEILFLISRKNGFSRYLKYYFSHRENHQLPSMYFQLELLGYKKSCERLDAKRIGIQFDRFISNNVSIVFAMDLPCSN